MNATLTLIVKRIGLAMLTLLLVSIVIFAITSLLPVATGFNFLTPEAEAYHDFREGVDVLTKQEALLGSLRNALIPVITVIGLQMTTLVSGAVVIETVFSWNGVGDLLVGATLRRDYPVLQFGVLVVAFAVVMVNTLVDLAYAAVDPRVRLA